MENQKENLFLEKFRLLNSQEHSEEIHWSSSCSSDYEDTLINDRSNNQLHKKRVLKRKRKKKLPKNISNLSITILDTSRDYNNVIFQEKSPILGRKVRRRSTSPSPILKPSRSFCKDNMVTSPILTSKIIHIKSPILNPKTGSPKSAVKVRKKLFSFGNFNENRSENGNVNKQEISSELKIKKEPDDEETAIFGQSVKLGEIDENLTLNRNTTNQKLEFVKRVKSFFDSHFSSQNTMLSQNSISETSTPKNSTKTSDEIEAFTCKSQILPNMSDDSVDLQQVISGNSSENSVFDFNKHSKKIRYKKNGHAHRLNKLVKKQNASLSLWQHERFLAANSNFVIPKGEFTVFRIKKVNFKYGCHLVECVDANDDTLLVLINSCYVMDNIVCETILKLYKPHKIVQYSRDYKLIINVTKFECSSLTS